MAKRANAQRFNYRAKPERVEIVTEGVEGTPSVEVPFIMGVMSNLSGANNDQLPELDQREFTEDGIDADNFDDFLKKQKPRVRFTVPSSLGKGKDLEVDITFDSLDDFLPDAVARKVPGLRELLALRTELDSLKTYAGKAKIRKLLEKLAEDEGLRKEFASAISTE